jgi:hypothetical protein
MLLSLEKYIKYKKYQYNKYNRNIIYLKYLNNKLYII